MAAPIVLTDLTLGYDGHPAVHHVSGAIQPGALLAVVGPNGGGKSTLIKALADVLKPLGGRIDGLTGQRVAYLPQQATLELGFPISVGEFAAMGLWNETGAFGGFSAAQRQRVRDALAAVGLEGYADVPIDQLSGGQLQRTLFGRLMLQDASVLLLDEPFAAIDQRTIGDLLELLRGWHRAGKTVLAVLHDLQQVREVFPETLMLARELLAWGPTAAVLTRANLQRMQAMPEAFDAHAEVCEVPEFGAAQARTHTHGGAPHAHLHPVQPGFVGIPEHLPRPARQRHP